jgi:hypothetical protein
MHNENYRKDFLNNLIALNSFAEVLAEQENPEPSIINKLKERTLQMYQTLVAIEFDGKIINQQPLQKSTESYVNNTTIPTEKSILQANDAFFTLAHTTEQAPITYTNTNVEEMNSEINNLFVTNENSTETANNSNEFITNENTLPIAIDKTPEFIINSTITQATLTNVETIAQETLVVNNSTIDVQQRVPLKNFLGFNDKIQIQRYLFDNNNEALTNFMTIIDNCETSQRAINVINEHKNSLGWDKESEPFHNLIAIIEQKFR